MNMLDPTAIANPEDYGPEDIKGLFIRRFKKDIQEQVKSAFKERKISRAYCQAKETEEKAFEVFADLKFEKLDQKKGAGKLFKTTLEKALLSSPAACLVTIRNRIRRLEKGGDPGFKNDISQLKDLAEQVKQITPDRFSKYQKLLSILKDQNRDYGWTGKDSKDRLVIFTERIETLRFLQNYLPMDLNLKNKQVEILHGGIPDVEQQRIVENFGKEEAPVRLLIASDVASEGINLHYLSHRLIHFDIPWSLMVFQQRNGRIDRYGQEKTPYILYLLNQSHNDRIKGDMRILELLIRKDEEAVKNIGDPSALMGVYDIDEEEMITADAIETGKSTEHFEQELEKRAKDTFDPLALLMGETTQTKEEDAEDKIKYMPTLYQDDFHYLKEAIEHLKQSETLQSDFDTDNHQAIITATEDLKHRLRYTMPREVWPTDSTFVLSAERKVIQDEIKRSRKDENAWPRIHYLWQQNPVLEWINDKVVASFGRHEAPVLSLPKALEAGETVFIISGLIPNRKSHPLLQRWFGVIFRNERFEHIEGFESLLARTGLGKARFPNRGNNIDIDVLSRLLPETVKQARVYISEERRTFEEVINEKLNEQLTALERLKGKQYEQLELLFSNSRGLNKKDQRKREIDRKFDEFMEWVEDTMTTEDNPFLQVIAVLKGAE